MQVASTPPPISLSTEASIVSTRPLHGIAMADATGPVGDDLAKEICRRALLTPEEVIKEILLEKDELRRHQKAEEERIDRIKQPWLYEIKTPITDPPDINYRTLIIDDQETIDELLENRAIHFVERIEEYRRQDTSLEVEILGKYQAWIQSMKDHGANIGNKAHEDFLQGLQDEVEEDFRLVLKEWSQRWLLSQERRTPKEGITDILGGVAGCPCDKCDGLRMQSVAEKDKKHWALLEEQKLQGRSNFEWGTPIPGCDCGQCKWARKRTKDHDDKESLERNKGNIELSNGIPGCDCDECKFRQLKRHKKLRTDEWLRGRSYSQQLLRGCPCYFCDKWSSLWSHKRGTSRDIPSFWEDKAFSSDISFANAPKIVDGESSYTSEPQAAVLVDGLSSISAAPRGPTSKVRVTPSVPTSAPENQEPQNTRNPPPEGANALSDYTEPSLLKAAVKPETGVIHSTQRDISDPAQNAEHESSSEPSAQSDDPGADSADKSSKMQHDTIADLVKTKNGHSTMSVPTNEELLGLSPLQQDISQPHSHFQIKASKEPALELSQPMNLTSPDLLSSVHSATIEPNFHDDNEATVEPASAALDRVNVDVILPADFTAPHSQPLALSSTFKPRPSRLPVPISSFGDGGHPLKRRAISSTFKSSEPPTQEEQVEEQKEQKEVNGVISKCIPS